MNSAAIKRFAPIGLIVAVAILCAGSPVTPRQGRAVAGSVELKTATPPGPRPTVTFPGTWPTPTLMGTRPTSTPYGPPRVTPTMFHYPSLLYTNYAEGAPGSLFAVMGLQFFPTAAVTITVNSQTVGTVPGMAGWFVFYLDTQNVADGWYFVGVRAGPTWAQTAFRVDWAQPLHATVNTADPIFVLPPGWPVARQTFLPIVVQ